MKNGFKLLVAHEWVAHDPKGSLKPSDAHAAGVAVTDDDGRVALAAARNGYVSFRVLVRGSGEYRLSASMDGGLEPDLFKAWYHRMHTEGKGKAEYWPDALIPLPSRGTAQRLPDPDNRIPGQTTQEFWVDIFVPRDARPGRVEGEVRLISGRDTVRLPVRVDVLEPVIPDEPCITMDNNSYGCRWLPDMYPKAFAGARTGAAFWNTCTKLLHNYYRVVHEHRAVLHNLGYGHAGNHDPIYGPRTEGGGHARRLVDWGLFDRHYGPLLTGRAFAAASPGSPRPRRQASPIWGVYTPITPDWPASYLWWGQKGYEVEFTRGIREFDAHFQKNGWTRSNVEFFFNHKKRYRWFEWDGDEPKYLKDMGHHKEMIRMWDSVTLRSPVKWVYRMDASWQMKNQFDLLGGHRNFWVCGGFHRWYPEEMAKVVDRGEITWWYNGTPPVQAASSGILGLAYETWIRRLHGNCQWLTVNPGPDPWFDCNGAGTGSFYPGERFGIAGPIPSIRAKVLRNGIQDIDLMNQSCERKGNAAKVRAELAAAIPIPVWTRPPRAALELPPEDWDSHNLQEDHEPVHVEKKSDSCWWMEIRRRATGGVMEAKP